MSATPFANGGRLPEGPAHQGPAHLRARRGARRHLATRARAPSASSCATCMRRTLTADGGGTFRLFCPDETASNRLQAVFEATDRCLQAPLLPTDQKISADGRVMEVLSEHLCSGWLEGYLLSGRHGVFATYEAFAMVSASMTIQHVKWLQHAQELRVARAGVLAQHPADQHLLAQRPQRVLPPGARPHRLAAVARAGRRPGVAAAGRQQPGCRSWTTACAARTTSTSSSSTSSHTCSTCRWTRPTSSAPRARASGSGPPTSDPARSPTSSSRPPATCRPRRRWRPPSCCASGLRSSRSASSTSSTSWRCCPRRTTRTATSTRSSTTCSPRDRPVIFAFHGYPRAVHQLVHGRSNPGRFHVRGFSEQGTTTTPFDMVVLNRVSRYHLAIEALRRSLRRPPRWHELTAYCNRDAGQAPALHPGAPRGHARGARLDRGAS